MRVIVLQFRGESMSIVAEEWVGIVMQGTNTKHNPKESKHQKIKAKAIIKKADKLFSKTERCCHNSAKRRKD